MVISRGGGSGRKPPGGFPPLLRTFISSVPLLLLSRPIRSSVRCAGTVPAWRLARPGPLPCRTGLFCCLRFQWDGFEARPQVVLHPGSLLHPFARRRPASIGGLDLSFARVLVDHRAIPGLHQTVVAGVPEAQSGLLHEQHARQIRDASIDALAAVPGMASADMERKRANHRLQQRNQPPFRDPRPGRHHPPRRGCGLYISSRRSRPDARYQCGGIRAFG